jgi:hypothetical protein
VTKGPFGEPRETVAGYWIRQLFEPEELVKSLSAPSRTSVKPAL